MSSERHIQILQKPGRIEMFTRVSEKTIILQTFQNKQDAISKISKDMENYGKTRLKSMYFGIPLFAISTWIGFIDHNPWSIPGVIASGIAGHISESYSKSKRIARAQIEELRSFDPEK